MNLTVKEAKEVAKKWIYNEASGLPEFHAAFYHGSVNWLSDGSVFPSGSDLDIIIIPASHELPPKKKFSFENLLIELTWLLPDQYSSAEQILGNYHLAGNFSRTEIILDLTGHFSDLQKKIIKHYAERKWVEARCKDALNNALKFLNSLKETDPVHDQVTNWLFARGVLAHILLAAGLENPTVRKRYVTLHKLLSRYGQTEFYESVLNFAGFSSVTKNEAENHLLSLTDIYDKACEYLHSPYAFAVDISPDSRKIAIEGSQELISNGFHREAMFWILATYCRCLHILFTDAPAEVHRQYKQAFYTILFEFDILSFEDRKRDNDRLINYIPQVMRMAEWLIAQNPPISSGE